MKIFDVTLREGDQMPGRNYSADQKIKCARLLDELGVDYIQTGFPATGEKDQAVIRELSGSTRAEIVGLARAMIPDIELAIESNADIIDVFVPISDRQIEYFLGRSRESMFDSLQTSIDFISDQGCESHLTLADAFRTDYDHILDVVNEVDDVSYIALADTVGSQSPPMVRKYLETIRKHVDLAKIGVHFHDDLGCATGNALIAHELGIGKVDVSVSSLGERAGNCSLEEVIASCSVIHQETFNIDESALIPTCTEILSILGEECDERKPILGDMIHTHESGIHTSAMLEDPSILEPYPPAQFGGKRRLIFGTKTGRSGAKKILDRAGVDYDDETVDSFMSVLCENDPIELNGALRLAAELYNNGSD